MMVKWSFVLELAVEVVVFFSFLSTLGRWLLSSGKSGRAQSGTDADDVPQRSISGLVAQHTIHGFSVMEMD